MRKRTIEEEKDRIGKDWFEPIKIFLPFLLIFFSILNRDQEFENVYVFFNFYSIHFSVTTK